MGLENSFEQAKARRLQYLQQSPGWPDLLAILKELEQEAVTAVNTFEGWDRDRQADLVLIQRTVAKTVSEIVKRIEKNILAGTSPDVLHNEPDGESEQLSDEQIEAIIETRIPGTY